LFCSSGFRSGERPTDRQCPRFDRPKPGGINGSATRIGRCDDAGLYLQVDREQTIPGSLSSLTDGNNASMKATDQRSDEEVAVFAPALLLVVELHESADLVPEVHLHAGGQGYWVVRMVQALDARPLPCICVGGEPGDALRALVAADGLDA
jgi:hypothetical protein